MRMLGWLSVLLICTTGALANDSLPAHDRKAIEQTISNWETAWKTKNAKLAAHDYSADADWTNAFGMTRRGRTEIEALLEEVFLLPFVMAGESETASQSIRRLAPELVLVITRVERAGQLSSGGEEIGVRHTTHHRILQKTGDQWHIVSHLISDARETSRPAH